jgi:hypothetical protein
MQNRPDRLPLNAGQQEDKAPFVDDWHPKRLCLGELCAGLVADDQDGIGRGCAARDPLCSEASQHSYGVSIAANTLPFSSITMAH